ncbi:MAG TPA: MazG nucleotide pyrophosphohydrolase domain-containing protein [Candidatus Saccharimonadales bacterium]|nr:MazG nucleotide pyrophosphohydrolase domain-containing protein [Candidatus Saccharimonadales bacterium]
MSDIKILEQRAMEIRRKYDQLDKDRNRQPWNTAKLARGFKKDVNELLTIVEQDMIDRKKASHELGDCLWSILVIARKLDIDLERSFWTTMAEIEQRFKDGQA